LYEATGNPCETSINVCFKYSKIVETDCLENPIDGQNIDLTALKFGKFELRTFKFLFSDTK
ncbi:MAG: hypothetical protein LBN25_04540, partial [Christensenellaceae bacterium]|nr:hypothetical protein [Christensenellaceae bacterium]